VSNWWHVRTPDVCVAQPSVKYDGSWVITKVIYIFIKLCSYSNLLRPCLLISLMPKLSTCHVIRCYLWSKKGCHVWRSCLSVCQPVTWYQWLNHSMDFCEIPCRWSFQKVAEHTWISWKLLQSYVILKVINKLKHLLTVFCDQFGWIPV